MLLRLGEVPTVVVSTAEAAAVVMKTNDPMTASRPRSRLNDIISCGGKGIALAPYSDHWRQMRKLCIVELLSSKQVSRMEERRAEEVGNLLRTLKAAPPGGAVNLSEKVSALSNDVVCRAVFGGRCPRQGEYIRELEKAVDLLSGFGLVDLFPSSRLARWLSNSESRMKRSCDRINLIIEDIIAGRKAARAATGDGVADDNDMLGVLLRLHEERSSCAFPITMEIMRRVIFVSS
jgi:cytochrome P450